MSHEQELVLLREESARLKANADADRRRNRDLEMRLVNAESANNSLQRKMAATTDARRVLENEVMKKTASKPMNTLPVIASNSPNKFEISALVIRLMNPDRMLFTKKPGSFFVNWFSSNQIQNLVASLWAIKCI